MSRSEIVVERAAGAHNLVIALISYMFGVFVFLPMAKSVEMPIFEIVIASFVFLIFVSFLYRGLPFLDILVIYVTHALTDWWVTRKDLDILKSSEIYSSMYNLVIAVLLFVLWWFSSPLLRAVNPALNGLILIIVLFISLSLFLVKDVIRTRALHEEGLTR